MQIALPPSLCPLSPQPELLEEESKREGVLPLIVRHTSGGFSMSDIVLSGIKRIHKALRGEIAKLKR